MRSSERSLVHSFPLRAALWFAALLGMSPQWLSATGPEPLAAAQALQGQRAARLQAMGPEQRVQFGQRLAEWNALPLAEREDRRARYQAWLQLDEAGRIRLRAIAAEIATFPPQRQQALRLQFDALDASRAKRAGLVDQMAAAWILQGALERLRSVGE